MPSGKTTSENSKRPPPSKVRKRTKKSKAQRKVMQRKLANRASSRVIAGHKTDPTLPESATFNLTEPLLEAIKEEPVLDVPPSQPLNEVLLVIKDEIPIPSPEPIPEVARFCSLCLRSCTSDQMVEFSTEPSWNCLDVASGQDKLGLILGLELELERSVICIACWMMVETLADFREGCLKAATWRQRFSFGLDVGDGWLLKENVEALERSRKMVQEHVERIEIAEVDARNKEDSGVDQLPKVELLEEDEQEWVEVMQVIDSPDDSDMDPDSPEDSPMNETTEDAPEIVEKVELKAFSCKNCQRSFETKNGMSIHFEYCIKQARKKPLTKLYTCSICSANFKERNKLELHRNLHLGIKTLECRKDHCSKRFYQGSARTHHERKCNGNNLQEESSEDSSQDRVTEETQSETAIYSCSNCPRRYNTKAAFKRHTQSCNGPEEGPKLYTCTICSMEFPTFNNLDAHVNKHNGIKPYKCNRENCGQHFYGKFLLYQHNQTCGKDKPICTICGVQLSSKVTLRAHMATHADASFGCETCGKKFKSNRVLKKHRLVHTDERNYPCSECEKAFKSSYALQVHMRIHTQEKPYSCTVCGQGFVYKSLVKPHMERHHAGEN